jgi:hypothetical protein
MLRRCLLVAALSWAADFVAVAEIAQTITVGATAFMAAFRTAMLPILTKAVTKLTNRVSSEYR